MAIKHSYIANNRGEVEGFTNNIQIQNFCDNK